MMGGISMINNFIFIPSWRGGEGGGGARGDWLCLTAITFYVQIYFAILWLLHHTHWFKGDK